MDDLQDKTAAGEGLMEQAVDALRRYQEARDTDAAPEEVERLRMQAEWLFEAAGEYQRQVLTGAAVTTH